MPRFTKRMDTMAGSAQIMRGRFGAMNDPETISFGGAPAHKVAYVAGAGCFAGNTGEGKNCMRISLGNGTPEQIEIGMKRLGDLIKSKLQADDR